VAKLFHIVQPDHAVFGQKDAQQAFLVRRMVADLDMPLKFETVPTVREPDGLAMSSRNRYLDADERRTALALSEALGAAEAAAGEGLDEVLAEAAGAFGDHDGIELDYLVVVDPETFLPVDEGARGPATVLVAARIGATRLIDNADILLG
jgi:pantoate--beta-alanine ligase